jgi:ATP-binding cassette subfamily B protein
MGMVTIKQQDAKDCGIACLAAIGKHYGLHLPMVTIRLWAQTDLQGTNLLGMLHAAKQMGFESKALRGTREQLISLPLPAIVHGVIEQRLTHFMVISELNDHYVKVMDPTFGETRKITWPEFENFWTGIVLLIQPAENFQAYNAQTPLYARIWKMIYPFKFRLLISWLAATFYTFLGLTTSLFIQQIADVIIPQKNLDMLQHYAIGMAGILLLQFGFQAFKSHYVLDTGHQLDRGIMGSYFSHIYNLPQRFFDTYRVGEIMSRVSDAVKIRHFANEVLLDILLNASIVLTAFGVLFCWDARLAWYMCSMIPLHLLIFYFASRWNKEQERNMMEQTAHLENHLVESLSNIRTLKLFQAQDFLKQKTIHLLDKFLKMVLKSNRLNFFSDFMVQCIRAFFTLLLLWKGGELVIQESLSIGELFALFALYGYFSGPLAQLIQANKAHQSAHIASERFHDVMEMLPDDVGLKKPHADFTNISFQQISFQYGFRKNILKNLTIQIRAGEFTGIVGESGSGKSTIFHLLQKIYTPQTGKISWDGESFDCISTEQLRAKIACVPQEIALFNGSISENIALGEISPNVDRVKNLSKRIGLDPIIKQFEHGLETIIGENGIALSGGQKQRIAIARALYRQPEVLLLDEATAALDSTAEAQILQVIREEVRTIVLISHRMHNFKNADLIYVIDAGTCVESGNHSTLMEAKNVYFNLCEKQNAILV